MNDIPLRKIKTGGDPRTLPDYTALRDELSKLNHPARPDVNWSYVEKLCLSLFEQNGVELQAAAWYTLARTQLAGLFGLNEGMAILEALIRYQWDALWPQHVHARAEILSSLSQRLQHLMRMCQLDHSNLSQLYQAEQLLISLGEILQRLELKHLSQFDALRIQMHNNVVRLENSGNTLNTGMAVQAGIVLPATMMNSATPTTSDAPSEEISGAVKWVYVAQTEHPLNVEAPAEMPAPVKKWKSFAAGMCTMLMISSSVVWAWHYLHRPDPLQIQLAASLAPFPTALTPAQLEVLRQQSPQSQALITQTQQQLVRLDTLSPDWNIVLSQQLLDQAQALWPEQAKPLAQQWLRQMNAARIPKENLNGWYEGMTTLRKLSDRLNRLDEQKGKYMTVSELKSVVFYAMQSFNKSLPAEEQLRALSETPSGAPLPVAARTQLEMHLKQLSARYAEIKQNASE
ncbi:MAG: type VI secretion system ImpA family N-terminal domain-containing protein [Enterobacter asburiae]|jgi:type VI secretion system protein VasL|nr:type VI secretion system ImpA family N-terminal domain-containing protein [Enterobacter asburiae]